MSTYLSCTLSYDFIPLTALLTGSHSQHGSCPLSLFFLTCRINLDRLFVVFCTRVAKHCCLPLVLLGSIYCIALLYLCGLHQSLGGQKKPVTERTSFPVCLSHLLNRNPPTLAGIGQRQRIWVLLMTLHHTPPEEITLYSLPSLSH